MPAHSITRLLHSGVSPEIKLEYHSLRKTLLILRSVNHKLRQQIIALLDEHEKLTVTDIFIRLGVDQSVASQHLSILRRSGVVTTKRVGKNIFYTLHKDRLNELAMFINESVKLIG
jgi:DNA-binding transcriptional ArsR family regulator